MAVGYTKFGNNGKPINEELEIEFGPGIEASAEATEPKVVEQEVAEQEVAEQEVAEQEVAEQEVAEQEVAEQEVAEQEVAEQEVSESEISQPEIVENEAELDKGEIEVPGYIAGHVISFENDNVIGHNSFGTNQLNVPDNVKQEFSRAYENVFTLDEISARAEAMGYNLAQHFEKGSISKFKSPEDLKNVLNNLRMPFNEKMNIIIDGDKGDDKIAYLTKEEKEKGENEHNSSEERSSDKVEENGNREDKMDDSRRRELGSMDPGEIHAVLNAENKDVFDRTCNTIEASNSRESFAEERTSQRGSRENEGMDIGNR